MIRVRQATINRTNLDTLWFIIVAQALSTELVIDLIDLIALEDCLIRALRLTHIAVDTFIRNKK